MPDVKCRTIDVKLFVCRVWLMCGLSCWAVELRCRVFRYHCEPPVSCTVDLPEQVVVRVLLTATSLPGYGRTNTTPAMGRNSMAQGTMKDFVGFHCSRREVAVPLAVVMQLVECWIRETRQTSGGLT